MFNQAPGWVKAVVGLLAFNWCACGALSLLVGGTALGGKIDQGQYFVRRNPNPASPFVVVSPEFWTFSLFYSLITFGGTFLILAFLFTWYRPSWDRGVVDLLAIAFGLFVLVAVALEAIPQLHAWAAA